MKNFVCFDSSDIVPLVFDLSVIIVWIKLRLVDLKLKMLSTGLLCAISNVRATNFTARTTGPL